MCRIRGEITDTQSVENKTTCDVDPVLTKQLIAFNPGDETLNRHMQDTLGGFERLIDAFTFDAVPPPMYPDKQECGLPSCTQPSSIFEIDSNDFSKHLEPSVTTQTLD